jgi:hypothetical protein
MSLVILHHLLNVFVQLPNKRRLKQNEMGRIRKVYAYTDTDSWVSLMVLARRTGYLSGISDTSKWMAL